ncbi:MAG: STAS domain-containing protein [Thermoleophilia bacterium]
MEALRIDRPEPGLVVLALVGEHDIATRRELDETARALIDEPSLLVVDLTCASYLDSETLGVLPGLDEALRRQGARLTLVLGRSDVIARAVRITGMLEVIPHAATLDEAIALARLNAPPLPAA